MLQFKRWLASTPGLPRSISSTWGPHRWKTASEGPSGKTESVSWLIYCLFWETISFSLSASPERKTWESRRKTRCVTIDACTQMISHVSPHFSFSSCMNIYRVQTFPSSLCRWTYTKASDLVTSSWQKLYPLLIFKQMTDTVMWQVNYFVNADTMQLIPQIPLLLLIDIPRLHASASHKLKPAAETGD